jgi:hypothetical protein
MYIESTNTNEKSPLTQNREHAVAMQSEYLN